TQSGQTLIGGADPGAGNVIAYNHYNGIDIRNSTRNNESDGEINSNTIYSNVLNGIVITRQNLVSLHFRVTQNSVYANGPLGSDRGDDGVTPNDWRGHDGPNNFQNFPVVTSVTASDTSTIVSGTLKSAPQSVFRIEFFGNAAGDPSGHGEGQTYLGFVI